jgi:hypothetical protein
VGRSWSALFAKTVSEALSAIFLQKLHYSWCCPRIFSFRFSGLPASVPPCPGFLSRLQLALLPKSLILIKTACGRAVKFADILNSPPIYSPSPGAATPLF